MFKTGEKVYYPEYGKAIIEAIEEREVMGVVRPYYILKGLEREVTIMIPENMIELAGSGGSHEKKFRARFRRTHSCHPVVL